ncbi:MAG: radical SAM protein [Zetaproteobacteria bacterium]|nr:MAG: radical SAM protein [Zetaproteobacteria bacterium]
MNPAQLRILEIYDSIQGESSLAGTPCTLVRLAGCPLRCDYCDTPQGLAKDSGAPMSVDAIVERVRASMRPLVLVTGGEPMAQRALPELLKALSALPAIVQLETSGAYDICSIEPPVRRILDVKTPASGESARNKWSNLENLRSGDEVKFVLCDERDYAWSRDIVRQRLRASPATILFSPCWGRLEPHQLAEWILRDHLEVRLQLQLHKYIWGSEATGV